jgi:hypothetical protein
VVEKSTVIWKFLPVKTQGIQNSFFGFRMRNETAVIAYAQSRQSETGGGDAPQIAFIGAPDIAAISNDARIWIRLFPEIAKVGGFQLLKKCVVLVGKRFHFGNWGWRVQVLRGADMPRRSMNLRRKGSECSHAGKHFQDSATS